MDVDGQIPIPLITMGLGALINVGFEVFNNGWSLDGVAMAAMTGAMAGAGGSSLLLNAILGSTANGLNNAYKQFDQIGSNYECFDYKKLGRSIVLGTFGNLTGFGISKTGNFIKNIRKYKKTMATLGTVSGGIISNQ